MGRDFTHLPPISFSILQPIDTRALCNVKGPFLSPFPRLYQQLGAHQPPALGPSTGHQRLGWGEGAASFSLSSPQLFVAGEGDPGGWVSKKGPKRRPSAQFQKAESYKPTQAYQLLYRQGPGRPKPRPVPSMSPSLPRPSAMRANAGPEVTVVRTVESFVFCDGNAMIRRLRAYPRCVAQESPVSWTLCQNLLNRVLSLSRRCV